MTATAAKPPALPQTLPLAAARQLLSCARSVSVVTGAGISAPSGLPVYRSTGQAWDSADLEVMSHASRYGNHLPELWTHWSDLRTMSALARPNPAHQVLADLDRLLTPRRPDTAADQPPVTSDRVAGASAVRAARAGRAVGAVRVITQNVDGLHTKAGSSTVLELHGSIRRSRCMRRRCGFTFTDPRTTATTAPAWNAEQDAERVLACPRCGGPVRPDVVLFGERIPARDLRTARQWVRSSQVCIYVGTSGTVWPARELVAEAHAAGALCILVNADPWSEPHPAFDFTFIGAAELVLPELLDGLLD